MNAQPIPHYGKLLLTRSGRLNIVQQFPFLIGLSDTVQFPIHPARHPLNLVKAVQDGIQLGMRLLVQLILIRMLQVFLYLTLKKLHKLAVPVQNGIHPVDMTLTLVVGSFEIFGLAGLSVNGCSCEKSELTEAFGLSFSFRSEDVPCRKFWTTSAHSSASGAYIKGGIRSVLFHREMSQREST